MPTISEAAPMTHRPITLGSMDFSARQDYQSTTLPIHDTAIVTIIRPLIRLRLADVGHEFVLVDLDAQTRRRGNRQITLLGFERIFQQVLVRPRPLLLDEKIRD